MANFAGTCTSDNKGLLLLLLLLLWRYLLERPPRAWESRDRDSLGARTSLYCADPGGYVHHTRMLGVNLPLIFSKTIQ